MTRLLSISFTATASRQAEEAGRWWRENRAKAPGAFVEELERALELIAAEPGIGAQARSTRLHGVRRVLLHRVRYHVYYRVVEGTVQVLAVWHASRGTAPPITPN